MRALFPVLVVVGLFVPGQAGAATFTVNTGADGSGDCVTAGGNCTLREALLAAKTETPGEPDVIVLGPGVHENTGNDFTIAIGEQVSIRGAGPRATTVSEASGGDGRVFLVEQDARLTITDLAVTGSRDNSAVLMFGGSNSLDASRVRFTGNRSKEQGGAIDTTGGSVSLADSTIDRNEAQGEGGDPGKGGGIYVGPASTLALNNVTVSANSAGLGGGVHVAAGSAELVHATLAGNSSADLWTAPAPAIARLRGTIVGSCSASAPTSLGWNLDAGTACGLSGPGDLSGLDPLLGPLVDNGGGTDTLALMAGSPAIDAAGACPPPAADQRGAARPRGGFCDIGAFEATLAPPRLSRLRVRRKQRALLVRFRLDRPARVTFTLERCSRSRRRGCARWRPVRAPLVREVSAGARSVRMRAKRLPSGRYRLGARARDAHGAAGRVGVRFRV